MDIAAAIQNFSDKYFSSSTKSHVSVDYAKSPKGLTASISYGGLNKTSQA